MDVFYELHHQRADLIAILDDLCPNHGSICVTLVMKAVTVARSFLPTFLNTDIASAVPEAKHGKNTSVSRDENVIPAIRRFSKACSINRTTTNLFDECGMFFRITFLAIIGDGDRLDQPMIGNAFCHGSNRSWIECDTRLKQNADIFDGNVASVCGGVLCALGSIRVLANELFQ